MLVEFLMASGAAITATIRPAALRAASALMKKYRDTPMDFADATVVLLGEELGLIDILTLDRRGFSTY